MLNWGCGMTDYLLWKEVGVVEQLTEYSSSNTSIESVVIGTFYVIRMPIPTGVRI